uniref:Neuronal acetylcholine receptor subunit alpha-7-like n=1 Tax=Knipowitschia caucasica TaxID=637954 RepID=A0AAV2LV84_KNICA
MRIIMEQGRHRGEGAENWPAGTLRSTGTGLLLVGIFKSTCKIDVRWFPFDEQRCELKFGSWVYNGWALDLNMTEADLSGYTPNGEWDLVEVPGIKTDRIYPCCPEPYPDITYTVVMRRRTIYYGLNLLLPCIIISILALLVFMLPADSGEKISLGITVLLSLSVFMLLVADTMPATSDSVPLIAQYFATTMVIVGLSVIATVLVLQCHHHDPNGSKMPNWIRVFLLNWCARFLWMKRPGEDKSGSSCPLKGMETAHPTLGAYNNNPNFTAATSPDSGVMSVKPPQSGDPELNKIQDELRYITKRFRDNDEQGTVCNEWKFAASVIDRLCLVAFSFVTILCTICILMSAPKFADAISKDLVKN